MSKFVPTSLQNESQQKVIDSSNHSVVSKSVNPNYVGEFSLEPSRSCAYPSTQGFRGGMRGRARNPLEKPFLHYCRSIRRLRRRILLVAVGILHRSGMRGRVPNSSDPSSNKRRFFVIPRSFRELGAIFRTR